MSMTVGELVGYLDVDDKHFNSGLNRAHSHFGDVGGKMLKTIGAISAAFGGMFAAAKIKSFFDDAVGLASDLSESTSKVGVVFGDAAGQVRDFASTAAESMGMSSQQALEAAGTYGNLMVSLGLTEKQSASMSTTLVQLAGDLASFNNVDPTEALDALRSGLVGETEPLKRFGVNLNEATLKAKAMQLGLSDGKGVLDANAKAQAAYALILEQTKTAQGDYARTSDGLANSQRTLSAIWEDAKTVIGEKLYPVYQEFVGYLTDNIGPLTSVLEGFADATAKGLGWIADNVLPWLTEAFTNFVSGVESDSGRANSAFGGIISIVGGVRDIFTAAWPIILGAVEMFIDWLNSDAGQKLISSLLDLVGQAALLVQSVFEAVWPIVQQVVQTFIDFLSGPTGQQLITSLLDGISLVLGAVQKVFETAWPIIAGAVQTFIDFFNSDTGQKLIKTLLDGVTMAMGLLSRGWQAAWPFMQSALEVAKPLITAALAVIEGAVWLVVKAIDALKAAWEWIEKTANGPSPTSQIAAEAAARWDAAQAGLPKGQATLRQGGHSSGGFFNREHLAWISEGNQPELILPLSDQRRTNQLLEQAGLSGGFSDAGIVSELRGLRREITNMSVRNIVVNGNPGISTAKQLRYALRMA